MKKLFSQLVRVLTFQMKFYKRSSFKSNSDICKFSSRTTIETYFYVIFFLELNHDFVVLVSEFSRTRQKQNSILFWIRQILSVFKICSRWICQKIEIIGWLFLEFDIGIYFVDYFTDLPRRLFLWVMFFDCSSVSRKYSLKQL